MADEPRLKVIDRPVDHFAEAPVIGPPESKRTNPEVPIAGITDLAAINRVRTELQRVYDAADTVVRENGDEYFKSGCAEGRLPENIRAIETETVGDVQVVNEASIQLSARGATSPLSDEVLGACTRNGLPLKKITRTPATYRFSEKCMEDPRVMQAIKESVNRALNTIPDLPEKPLEFLAPDIQYVATEETLKALFAKRDAKLLDRLLPALSLMSVGKFVFGAPPGREDDLGRAIEITANLLENEEFRKFIQATAEKKAAERKAQRRRG